MPLKSHIRKPTIAESLVLVAIVAILIAILAPGVQWASSGTIRVPVRVLIFDADYGKPIANAHVSIFRASPLRDLKSLEESRDQYDSKIRVRDEDSGMTDADGTVVIEYEFRTGANHERPTAYAHLSWAWVAIQADGYGGVVVPVRHESQPSAPLRDRKELLVTIGLTPVK